MSNDEIMLKGISDKLDKIITLLKLSNLEKLSKFKEEINKDKVFAKIISLCDGTKNYSDMVKEIANNLGVAEITVKKKVSELTKYGIISITKTGKESYYNNTGLLD